MSMKKQSTHLRLQNIRQMLDVDEATENLMAAINALVKVDANNMMAYLAAALLALTAGAAVTCRRKIKNVR